MIRDLHERTAHDRYWHICNISRGGDMKWQRTVFGLHVTCVLLSYSLVGCAYLARPRITSPVWAEHATLLAASLSAGSGCLTGLVLMACKLGKSESFALAFSTIAAFLV